MISPILLLTFCNRRTLASIAMGLGVGLGVGAAGCGSCGRSSVRWPAELGDPHAGCDEMGVMPEVDGDTVIIFRAVGVQGRHAICLRDRLLRQTKCCSPQLRPKQLRR